MRVGLGSRAVMQNIYAAKQGFAERRKSSLSEGSIFAQRERSEGEANNSKLTVAPGICSLVAR